MLIWVALIGCGGLNVLKRKGGRIKSGRWMPSIILKKEEKGYGGGYSQNTLYAYFETIKKIQVLFFKIHI